MAFNDWSIENTTIECYYVNNQYLGDNIRTLDRIINLLNKEFVSYHVEWESCPIIKQPPLDNTFFKFELKSDGEFIMH